MVAVNGKGRLIADGKYALGDVIGEGGMGLVYIGRHVVLNRKIAVKVLHPEFVHRSDATDRFLKEARLVSQLRHQNTVQLLDFGTDGREYWLVMEYLDGEDLAGLIAKNGKIPPLRALNIAIQLLAALGEAHDVGIVHCDLKPANIMIIPWQDDDGMPSELVKVLDFGIATLAEDSRPSKEVAGTPDYMSPEQAQGQGVEARSDLYAVGIMLHEMLTGRPPFSKGDAVKTMWAQVEDPPPLLRELEPTLPSSLEVCLQTALSKTKDGRYPHARAFRARLVEIVDEMSAPVRRPTTKNNAVATVAGQAAIGREPRPRSKAMWLVVGLALIASVGAFALALMNSAGPSAPNATGLATIAVENPAATVAPIPPEALAADVSDSGGVDSAVGATAAINSGPDGLAEVPEDASITGADLGEAAEPDANPSAVSGEVVAIGVVSPEENVVDVDGARVSAVGEGLASTDRAVKTKPSAKEPSAVKPPDKPVVAVRTPGPTTPTPMTPDPEPIVPPDAVTPPRDVVAAVVPPRDTTKDMTPETTPPVPKPIPALDARANFADLAVKGSLPRSSIQRALDGAIGSAEDCYRDGAKAAGKDAQGNLKISFEVNVDGQLRNVVIQAFGLPGVAVCVQTALGRLRTRDRPDTGTVTATARLRFNPLPPR